MSRFSKSLYQKVWHGFVTRAFHRLKTGATRINGIGSKYSGKTLLRTVKEPDVGSAEWILNTSRTQTSGLVWSCLRCLGPWQELPANRFGAWSRLGVNGYPAWARRCRQAGRAMMILVWSCVTGCTPTTAPSSSDREVVPNPDVSKMEPKVAQLLKETRSLVVDDPTSVEAWSRLAMVCNVHSLYACAEFAYRRAYELDPKDFRHPYLLAQLLDDQGEDLDEAMTLYKHAVEMAPKYPTIPFRIGQLLARRGRNEQAKVAFLQATKLDPNSAAAHRELAQMLMKLDDLPGAMKHLERAAKLAPTDRATFSALAQAYARTGDRERAAAFADRSRRLPDVTRVRDPVRDPMQSLGASAGIYIQRGRKSLQASRFDEAIQTLRLAQEVRPDDPDVRRLLGTALGRVGRFDEALAEFDQAERLGPPGADDHLNWGNIFLGIGDREQAISHFQEALRIDPGFINAHFNLALTLERIGRRPEAIEHYQRVVAADPKHRAARRLAKLVDANP